MTDANTDAEALAVLAARIARHRVQRAPALAGLIGRLGPGLITGASDDDPSGIATYSQAGAQFGYAMCWVMLFCFPLMAAIQEISARMGRVTGQGSPATSGRITRPGCCAQSSACCSQQISSTLAPTSVQWPRRSTCSSADRLASTSLASRSAARGLRYSSYERYTSILKWTSFVLLAYVAIALVVDVPWRLVLYRTFVPNFSLSTDYVVTVVAVLGTTITPYCFFWQSSQEAEDERIDPAAHTLLTAPEEAPEEIGRMRFDTYIGMGYSNVIGLPGYPLHSSAAGGRLGSVLPTMASYVASPTATAW